MRVLRFDPICNGDFPSDKSIVASEYYAVLRLKVNHAVGIDRLSRSDLRIYRAEFWVDPGHVLCTNENVCAVDPFWDDYGTMYLRSPVGFLNVEVVKRYCQSDPCTSSGEIVVGRCRIPLPSGFNSGETRSFPLAKLDGEENRYAGDISIGMELKKLGRSEYPQFDCSHS